MLGLSLLWNAALRAGADPVIQAGGLYIINKQSRYVRPGVTFARAADVFEPQDDGSLGAISGVIQYLTEPRKFDAAGWIKRRASVQSVSVLGPDGMGQAYKLVEDTTPANSHYLESEYVSIAATRGCFIVKAGEVTEIGVRYIRDGGVGFGGANARVDLLTGAVTLGTIDVEPLANGWWKVTGRPDGTATTSVAIRISLVKSGSETYNGDGTSGVYVLAANMTNTTAPHPLLDRVGSQVPWGAKGVRLDPGWINSCLWGDELTPEKGWVIAGTPEVNAGGLSSPHGGAYTRLTVTAGVLSLVYRPTVSVTPGQSVTMSFMVRLGTMPAADWKCGIYNETASSWIAVDQVPVTPVSDAWTRVDLTVTVPAGCTAIRLYPFRSSPSVGGTLFLSMVCGTNTAYPVPLTPARELAVTVPAFSFGGMLADLGITLGGEYTIGVEYTLENLSANYQPLAFSISDNTFNDSIYLNCSAVNGPRPSTWSVVDGGVGQSTQAGLGPGAAVGVLRKTAASIKQNSIRPVYDGVLGVIDATATLPAVDRLFIGLNWSGGSTNAFQGSISKLWVIPNVALSDAPLKALHAIT